VGTRAGNWPAKKTIHNQDIGEEEVTLKNSIMKKHSPGRKTKPFVIKHQTGVKDAEKQGKRENLHGSKSEKEKGGEENLSNGGV